MVLHKFSHQMFVQIAIAPARLVSGLPGSALLNSFPYKARVSSRNGESDLATPLVLGDEPRLAGVPAGSSRGSLAPSPTTYRRLKVQNCLQLPGCSFSSLLLSCTCILSCQLLLTPQPGCPQEASRSLQAPIRGPRRGRLPTLNCPAQLPKEPKLPALHPATHWALNSELVLFIIILSYTFKISTH